MVVFFTALLTLSLLGMASLLGFKRYELAGGRVVFASARPVVGNFFKTTLWWIEKVLPALVRVYGRRLKHFGKVTLQQALARAIVWLERSLERVLHTVREQTEVVRAPGEASAFLREVAEHKRALTRRTRKPRIVDAKDATVEEVLVLKSEFEVE